MMLCMFLASCGSKHDTLLNEYKSIIGNEPTTAKNGVYTWKSLTKEAITFETSLKERTDKILEMLPTESNELKVSPSTHDIYTSYIWESPDFRVVLYLDYKKNAESVQLVYKEK